MDLRHLILTFLILLNSGTIYSSETVVNISREDIQKIFCGGERGSLNLIIPKLKEVTNSKIERISSEMSFNSLELECATMANYLKNKENFDLRIKTKSITKVLSERHQHCNDSECFTRWIESEFENIEVWFKDFKFLAGGVVPNSGRPFKEAYPIGHCPSKNPVCNVEESLP